MRTTSAANVIAGKTDKQKMKIEYVSHACLAIDTGDLKIVTDPWFHGPAYCGQWNVFPRPVNTRVLDDCQAVLFSHGHEDHFHPPTVEKLPKSARMLYPYTWYGGIKPYLNELGFRDVMEVPRDKATRLTPDTSVTYVVNNLDSIIVIESNGKVLVDVNDALHSYPPRIVDIFVRHILQRWPRIDTVFCGFGGASYFPNTIHCPGKNDLEIAEAREQMFVHAFCRIVHALNPTVVYRLPQILPCCVPTRDGSTKGAFRVLGFRSITERSTATRQTHPRFM